MSLFTKLPLVFGVAQLNAELEAQSYLWDRNPLRRTTPNSAHAQMTDIWVRYNDIEPHLKCGDFATFNDAHIPKWYEAWEALPALRKIIFDLMAFVQGEMLGGVLITRIPSGCAIAPHVDTGWHVEYYDKFYVSLKSAPGAVFQCNGESINPSAGDVYHFDNRLEHSVTNDSDQDRVTLIVCIRTDKYRKYYGNP